MKKLFLLFIAISILSISCKKKEHDEPIPPPTTGKISGTIISASTNAAVAGAKVVIFDANTNAPIGTVLTTDASGNYNVELPAGTYFIKVYRQGFNAIPGSEVSPIPFSLVAGTQPTYNYKMTESTVANAGFITGKVGSASGPISGVLVVANDGTTGYSSTTDKEGNYFIYNVPAGTYFLTGWMVGYNSDPTSTMVASAAESSNANITLSAGASGSVYGTAKNIAIETLDVDVALTDPFTRETIPGLSTMAVAQGYKFNKVPNGRYLARATYKNDGRSMDPDWIIKNGEPYVTVTGGGAFQRDFSITGAVSLISPNNEASSTKPVIVSGLTPTFSWESYPSSVDYVIEVMNSNGQVIWGGFTGSGVNATKNITIPGATTTVVYNYDGTAKEVLKSGQIYRWRIFASSKDVKAISGWKLISVSEDQRGLFIVQ